MIQGRQDEVPRKWREMPLAEIPEPLYRNLRVFSLDPSLSVQMATRTIAEAKVRVPWGDIFAPGPMGECVEVIDYDASTNQFYLPVDLRHPNLIASEGLAPSASDPRFHQQMVYAVAMKTIGHFEEALGRYVYWSSPDSLPGVGESVDADYVQRLRIYPHAFRRANAFYDPEKVALLFGYFPAQPSLAKSTFTGGLVFSCLSFDIIAHETTHAILDGIQRRYIEDTNPDVLAFHEGFSDLVALFQHFTLADLLKHQISNTQGRLESDTLLAQLAGQFAEGSGRAGALRDAIGEVKHKGGMMVWERATPESRDIHDLEEPHQRGGILVSAVFDAFIAIYNTRIADLLRIASDGTGILRPGALQADLVSRLADEASKAAMHVLSMLIRGLDYCPPIDLTFGEYLRAVLTADMDLVLEDRLGYRTAFIEAFRKWGIYPNDVHSLGETSLAWTSFNNMRQERDDQTNVPKLITQQLIRPAMAYIQQSHNIRLENKDSREKIRRKLFVAEKHLRSELEAVMNTVLRHRGGLGKAWAIAGKRTPDEKSKAVEEMFGLNLVLKEGEEDVYPELQVHAARVSIRTNPESRTEYRRDMIIHLTQSCHVDRDSLKTTQDPNGMRFRGGCTLIIDTLRGEIRYAIRKKISSESRRKRQSDYEKRAFSVDGMYPVDNGNAFEMLHSSEDF